MNRTLNNNFNINYIKTMIKLKKSSNKEGKNQIVLNTINYYESKKYF